MPASKRASAISKKQDIKKKQTTSHAKAGLKFPVARIGKMMRRDRLAGKIGRQPQVVMTSVLEYITSEILELAGNICQEKNKKRIVPRHLMLAVQGDEELCKLTDGSIFREAGVKANIDPALLPAKKEKAGKKPVVESQEV